MIEETTFRESPVRNRIGSNVTGSGTGLTYQWFLGKSPSTKKPIPKATAASFKTPPLTTTTSYWVRVTRSGIVANSKTATVTVSAPLPGEVP